MVVILNGKEYKAIQLGTVMTHPDYRHQGLAAKLMNHTIEKYEQDYDFIYLFAKSAFIVETDDTLFVRPLLKDFTGNFLFPLTSHA